MLGLRELVVALNRAKHAGMGSHPAQAEQAAVDDAVCDALDDLNRRLTALEPVKAAPVAKPRKQKENRDAKD